MGACETMGNHATYWPNMRLGMLLSLVLACGCSSAKNAGSDAGAPAPDLAPPPPPSFCPAPVAGDLQEVTGTPASPYYVAHPAQPDAKTSTVIFLPGGPGSRDIGSFIYANYLQNGNKANQYRLVVPYSAAGDFPSEADRTTMILDEVLACFGGDPNHVHLAGTSNGGVAAYAQMIAHGDRFVSLLGCPGLFDKSVTDDQLKMVFAGKPVFNGVGGLDTQWGPPVKATNTRLTGLGITSQYVEFPGQMHIVNSSFDPSIFFDFWSAH